MTFKGKQDRLRRISRLWQREEQTDIIKDITLTRHIYYMPIIIIVCHQLHWSHISLLTLSQTKNEKVSVHKHADIMTILRRQVCLPSLKCHGMSKSDKELNSFNFQTCRHAAKRIGYFVTFLEIRTNFFLNCFSQGQQIFLQQRHFNLRQFSFGFSHIYQVLI